jgi:hypothetical protein
MVAGGRPRALATDCHVHQVTCPSLGNEGVVEVVGLVSSCALEFSGSASPTSIQNRALTAPAGWILVFSQFKQVLVLPVSFFDHGSIGIGGCAGPMDGL